MQLWWLETKNTKSLMFLKKKKTLCKCFILNDFITHHVLNNQMNLPFSHYPQLLSGAGVKIVFESRVFSCFIKEYRVTAPLPHNPDLCCKNIKHHIITDKGKKDLSNLLPQIVGVILKPGDGRDSLFFYRAWEKKISRDWNWFSFNISFTSVRLWKWAKCVVTLLDIELE